MARKPVGESCKEVKCTMAAGRAIAMIPFLPNQFAWSFRAQNEIVPRESARYWRLNAWCPIKYSLPGVRHLGKRPEPQRHWICSELTGDEHEPPVGSAPAK